MGPSVIHEVERNDEGNHGNQGSLGILHPVISRAETHVSLHCKVSVIVVLFYPKLECVQILVRLPSVKFNENPFRGSRVTCRLTDG
jgi:hypothetical protein